MNLYVVEGNWVTAMSTLDYFDAKFALFGVKSGSVVMCLEELGKDEFEGDRRHVLCEDGRTGWVVVEGLRQI